MAGIWQSAQAAAEEDLRRKSQAGTGAGKNNTTTTGSTGNTPYGGGAATYADKTYGGGDAGSFNGAYNTTSPGAGTWWGGVNEMGVIDASKSDDLFFDMYASDVYGLRPGSNTGMWMGETFNPYALADAFGNASSTPDTRMAQGSAFAQAIDQPGYQRFDPGQIVVQALSNAAAAGQGGGGNGPIGMLAVGTPQQQMQNTVAFLREALAGIMTEEALGAYIYYVQRKGMEILQGAYKGGNADFEKGGGSFPQKLLAALGPNGGL